MKRSTVCFFGTVMAVGLTAAVATADPPATVKDSHPVVVKTEPQAGDMQVDAAKVTEIRVTFSKKMADHSWSWSQISSETYPKTTGKAHYAADKRTCVLPVKLEPGRAYVLWLNPAKFQGFRDADRNPAVFFPLVFETKR
jgi:RNA polymerase sigma-70 factor (ECF subfamily)